MTTYTQIRDYAEKIGAELERARVRGLLDVTAYPPKGKRWKESGGLPFLIAHQLPGRSVSDLYADLLARMKEGLEDLP